MNRIKLFLNNESGSALTIMAAGFVILTFAVLALSVDLNRGQRMSSDNQGAVDSAALAAAEFVVNYKKGKILEMGASGISANPPASDIRLVAEKAYKTNLGGDSKQSSAAYDETLFVVEYDSQAYEVRVKACSELPGSLVNLEQRNLEACNSAIANFGVFNDNKPNEIAFAIEASRTMFEIHNERPFGFRNNFIGVFNDFVPYFKNSGSFVSIVPYYFYTHFAPYENFVSTPGTPPGLAARNRFNDPLYNAVLNWPEVDPSYSINVLSPGFTPNIFTGAPVFNHKNVRSADDKPIYVQPLTDQFGIVNGILAMINESFHCQAPQRASECTRGFTPKTSGLVGIINAWHTLNPVYKGVYTKRSAYEFIAYPLTHPILAKRATLPSNMTDSKKYIVLIASQDDEEPASDHLDYNPANDAQNETYYRQVCDAIKAQGVEIYVMFVRGQYFADHFRDEAKPYMKACASSPAHFKDANITLGVAGRDMFRKKLREILNEIKAKSSTSSISPVRLVK